MTDQPESTKPDEVIVDGEPELVQIRNPRSGLFVMLDRSVGVIVSHKGTPGPYGGVKIVPLRERR